MEGDEISGVTIMRMEKGLDTGPILLQQAVSLEEHETGRVSVRASGRTRRKAHGRRAGHDRGAARGLCAPE